MRLESSEKWTETGGWAGGDRKMVTSPPTPFNYTAMIDVFRDLKLMTLAIAALIITRREP